MDPFDFVMKQCRKIALQEGLSERDANEVAVLCHERYKRAQGRATDLFAFAKQQAKKRAKK